MIAKQTVYLNDSRSAAVPDGDPNAKFLLVRKGSEIDEKSVKDIDGALELATSEAKEGKTKTVSEKPADSKPAAKPTKAKKK